MCVITYVYKLWNIIEIQESLIFDHYTYLSLSKFVTKRACPLNQCIGNHMTTMVVQEVVNMGFSKQKLVYFLMNCLIIVSSYILTMCDNNLVTIRNTGSTGSTV